MQKRGSAASGARPSVAPSDAPFLKRTRADSDVSFAKSVKQPVGTTRRLGSAPAPWRPKGGKRRGRKAYDDDSSSTDDSDSDYVGSSEESESDDDAAVEARAEGQLSDDAFALAARNYLSEHGSAASATHRGPKAGTSGAKPAAASGRRQAGPGAGAGAAASSSVTAAESAVGDALLRSLGLDDAAPGLSAQGSSSSSTGTSSQAAELAKLHALFADEGLDGLDDDGLGLDALLAHGAADGGGSAAGVGSSASGGGGGGAGVAGDVADLLAEYGDLRGTLQQEFKLRRNLRRSASGASGIAPRRGAGAAPLPHDVAKLLGEASLEFAMGKAEAALELLEEVVQRAPAHAPAWSLLADVHAQLGGDPERAAKALAIAAAADADNASLWRRLVKLSGERAAAAEADGRPEDVAAARADEARAWRELARITRSELQAAAVEAMAVLSGGATSAGGCAGAGAGGSAAAAAAAGKKTKGKDKGRGRGKRRRRGRGRDSSSSGSDGGSDSGTEAAIAQYGAEVGEAAAAGMTGHALGAVKAAVTLRRVRAALDWSRGPQRPQALAPLQASFVEASLAHFDRLLAADDHRNALRVLLEALPFAALPAVPVPLDSLAAGRSSRGLRRGRKVRFAGDDAEAGSAVADDAVVDDDEDDGDADAEGQGEWEPPWRATVHPLPPLLLRVAELAHRFGKSRVVRRSLIAAVDHVLACHPASIAATAGSSDAGDGYADVAAAIASVIDAAAGESSSAPSKPAGAGAAAATAAADAADADRSGQSRRGGSSILKRKSSAPLVERPSKRKRRGKRRGSDSEGDSDSSYRGSSGGDSSSGSDGDSGKEGAAGRKSGSTKKAGSGAASATAGERKAAAAPASSKAGKQQRPPRARFALVQERAAEAAAEVAAAAQRWQAATARMLRLYGGGGSAHPLAASSDVQLRLRIGDAAATGSSAAAGTRNSASADAAWPPPLRCRPRFGLGDSLLEAANMLADVCGEAQDYGAVIALVNSVYAFSQAAGVLRGAGVAIDPAAAATATADAAVEAAAAAAPGSDGTGGAAGETAAAASETGGSVPVRRATRCADVLDALQAFVMEREAAHAEAAAAAEAAGGAGGSADAGDAAAPFEPSVVSLDVGGPLPFIVPAPLPGTAAALASLPLDLQVRYAAAVVRLSHSYRDVAAEQAAGAAIDGYFEGEAPLADAAARATVAAYFPEHGDSSQWLKRLLLGPAAGGLAASLPVSGSAFPGIRRLLPPPLHLLHDVTAGSDASSPELRRAALAPAHAAASVGFRRLIYGEAAEASFNNVDLLSLAMDALAATQCASAAAAAARYMRIIERGLEATVGGASVQDGASPADDDAVAEDDGAAFAGAIDTDGNTAASPVLPVEAALRFAVRTSLVESSDEPEAIRIAAAAVGDGNIITGTVLTAGSDSKSGSATGAVAAVCADGALADPLPGTLLTHASLAQNALPHLGVLMRAKARALFHSRNYAGAWPLLLRASYIALAAGRGSNSAAAAAIAGGVGAVAEPGSASRTFTIAHGRKNADRQPFRLLSAEERVLATGINGPTSMGEASVDADGCTILGSGADDDSVADAAVPGGAGMSLDAATAAGASTSVLTPAPVAVIGHNAIDLVEAAAEAMVRCRPGALPIAPLLSLFFTSSAAEAAAAAFPAATAASMAVVSTGAPTLAAFLWPRVRQRPWALLHAGAAHAILQENAVERIAAAVCLHLAVVHTMPILHSNSNVAGAAASERASASSTAALQLSSDSEEEHRAALVRTRSAVAAALQRLAGRADCSSRGRLAVAPCARCCTVSADDSAAAGSVSAGGALTAGTASCTWQHMPLSSLLSGKWPSSAAALHNARALLAVAARQLGLKSSKGNAVPASSSAGGASDVVLQLTAADICSAPESMAAVEAMSADALQKSWGRKQASMSAAQSSESAPAGSDDASSAGSAARLPAAVLVSLPASPIAVQLLSLALGTSTPVPPLHVRAERLRAMLGAAGQAETLALVEASVGWLVQRGDAITALRMTDNVMRASAAVLSGFDNDADGGSSDEDDGDGDAARKKRPTSAASGDADGDGADDGHGDSALHELQGMRDALAAAASGARRLTHGYRRSSGGGGGVGGGGRGEGGDIDDAATAFTSAAAAENFRSRLTVALGFAQQTLEVLSALSKVAASAASAAAFGSDSAVSATGADTAVSAASAGAGAGSKKGKLTPAAQVQLGDSLSRLLRDSSAAGSSSSSIIDASTRAAAFSATAAASGSLSVYSSLDPPPGATQALELAQQAIERIVSAFPHKSAPLTLLRIVLGLRRAESTQAFRRRAQRVVRGNLDAVPLVLLLVGELYSTRSYRAAVALASEAYRLSPDEPLISLMLAVGCLCLVFSRRSAQRHRDAVRALAFLANYRRLRFAEAQAAEATQRGGTATSASSLLQPAAGDGTSSSAAGSAGSPALAADGGDSSSMPVDAPAQSSGASDAAAADEAAQLAVRGGALLSPLPFTLLPKLPTQSPAAASSSSVAIGAAAGSASSGIVSDGGVQLASGSAPEQATPAVVPPAVSLRSVMPALPFAPLRLPRHVIERESLFNMGRALHALGMTHLAAALYERCLAVKEPAVPGAGAGAGTAGAAGAVGSGASSTIMLASAVGASADDGARISAEDGVDTLDPAFCYVRNGHGDRHAASTGAGAGAGAASVGPSSAAAAAASSGGAAVPNGMSEVLRRHAWVCGRALNVQREAALNLSHIARFSGNFGRAMQITATYLSYDDSEEEEDRE